jgi:hypothetical protein
MPPVLHASQQRAARKRLAACAGSIKRRACCPFRQQLNHLYQCACGPHRRNLHSAPHG